MPETTATTAGGAVFAIIAQNVLLQDASKQLGGVCRLYGDVAQLASGELVYRVAMPFADGTPATASGPYDPKTPPEQRSVARPTDFAASIRQVLEERPGGFGVLGETPEDRERIRFVQEWPFVASFVGLHAPISVYRVFDPGVVQCQTGIAADVRQLVADHAAGSFGDYGEYDDSPLTDEELFTIDRQPVLTQNKASIAAGLGPVRSRFPIDAAPKTAGAPTFYAGAPKRPTVDIVTLLRRGGTLSLVTLGHVD